MRIALGYRDGEAGEIMKRRRMRDEALLIDRDLLMLEKHCMGRTQEEVARIFRVSQQLVSHRFREEIPIEVREGMKALVERFVKQEGWTFVPDDAKDAMRKLMRRHRRERLKGVA